MEITFKTYLILCPMLFLAAFIDSIAGGGGLISIPAYMFTGIPIHFAYGTNKFSAGIAALFSSGQYIKNKAVEIKPTIIASVGAIIGAVIGTNLTLYLDEKILQITLMIVLPIVAIIILFQRKAFSSTEDKFVPADKLYFRAALIGLVMGAYDGFFGPGSGTFIIILMNAFLGFGLIKCCGSARIVNLSSNIASLIAYIVGGKVLWALAIPGAVCAVIGGYVGSKMAIKKGVKFIKPIILFVVVLLLIKIVYDFVVV